jgi:soluble lytic murein transglycosylase-like protein
VPLAPARRRARRPTRSSAVPTRTALLRVLGGLLCAGLLLLGVPPLRAAASGAGEVLMGALTAGREVEARQLAVVRYALRYRIAYDLAAAIERSAVAEGIDPELAFRLVWVESHFRERAVSSAGALGLTQLMPATAASLQPGITPAEIFERETNLRLGFRYLRWLLGVYDGDVVEALHAYNRGPGTVARIRAQGGDPANGYADLVLRTGRPDSYRGTGTPPFAAAP